MHKMPVYEAASFPAKRCPCPVQKAVLSAFLVSKRGIEHSFQLAQQLIVYSQHQHQFGSTLDLVQVGLHVMHLISEVTCITYVLTL
jgi:hypothetical protein